MSQAKRTRRMTPFDSPAGSDLVPYPLAAPPAAALGSSKDAFHALLDKSEPHYEQPNPFFFVHPFRCLVLGDSGSGKTYWLIHYLLDDEFDLVIWCATPKSLKQEKLKVLKDFYGSRLHFLPCDVGPAQHRTEIFRLLEEGEKENAKRKAKATPEKPFKPYRMLIVLDDQIMHSKDKFIQEMFVSGRHWPASIVEITQQIFATGTRTHRLNTNYYVIFKFPQVDEASRLFQQIMGKRRDLTGALLSAYDQISNRKPDRTKKQPPGCLIIDTKARKDENLKIRFRDTNVNCLIPGRRSVGPGVLSKLNKAQLIFRETSPAAACRARQSTATSSSRTCTTPS
jgi:hypothetical protein